MTFMGFGEWRPDVSDLNATFSPAVLNVMPRADGYGPAAAPSPYAAALPAACRGCFRTAHEDGTVTLFAGTAHRLYRLDNTTFTWVDVSRSTAPDFSYNLTRQDWWSFAQYDNRVIAAQIGSPPQVFTLGLSERFADLSPDAPQCRYVTVIGRFLVASGILGAPKRIQWSAINDIGAWIPGTDQSDLQDFADGGVVQGVVGGDQIGVVFQEQSIRQLIYAPGSAAIFQINRMPGDIGCDAPGSITQGGGMIFFHAPSGFHKMASTDAPVPIGKERIDRTFDADLSSAQFTPFLSACDPVSSRVVFAYGSVNGAPGTWDKLLVYDYLLDRWSPLRVSGEFIAPLGHVAVTLERIDVIYPQASLDTLPISLDEFRASGKMALAMFAPDHRMSLFAGPHLEATLESAETGGTRRILVRGIAPVTDAPGALGAISTRGALHEARVWRPETPMGVIGACPQRRDTRFFRARVRIPAGTPWTFCTGVEADIAAGGGR